MLLAAQRSWLHTLALPKHALCWRVSCEQPRHLGIYSRHRASTHSDKRVFARLAALLPKPTPGEPLRGLHLPSCSHLAVLAPQHFSEISTETHLPPTVLLVNPAQQHTHKKRERKKKKRRLFILPHTVCVLIPEPPLILVRRQADVWWELQAVAQSELTWGSTGCWWD